MEQAACSMLHATLQHCNIISVQHGTDNVQHAALQPAAVVIGSVCSLRAAMPHHTVPSCKTCRRRRSSRSVRCLPRVMVCVVCHVSCVRCRAPVRRDAHKHRRPRHNREPPLRERHFASRSARTPRHWSAPLWPCRDCTGHSSLDLRTRTRTHTCGA